MISHKLKYLFVHIPKTGGNSLTLMLKNSVEHLIFRKHNKLGKDQGIDIVSEITRTTSIKHKTYRYYNKMYGKRRVDTYFKFTIVRNPYDRALSYYYFNCSNKEFNKEIFIKFINTVMTDNQVDYITDDFHIVRFENLVDDLKKIDLFKGHYNFDKLQHINKSINSDKNYMDIFDNDLELKNFVYNRFKRDFIKFNYSY